MESDRIPIINDPRSNGFVQKTQSEFQVPGTDEQVKIELVKLGQPAAYAAESREERAKRLLQIKQNVSELEAVENSDEMSVSGDDDDDDEDEEEEEDFYTPGTEELYDARVKILNFSLERAKQRTGKQREASKTQDFTKILKHRRNINSKLSRIELDGTQLIQGNTRALSAVRFNKDSSLIACGSWDGNIYFLNKNELKLQFSSYPGYHSEKVSALDWNHHSDQNMLVSGGNEGTINIWNTEAQTMQTGGGGGATHLKPVHSIKTAHSNRITNSLYHPSGDYIASTSFDQTWKLWDVNRPEVELLEQEGHSKELFAASFHPDGSIFATGGLDAMARLWDLRSGRSIALLEGHIKGIYSMDWSDNGIHLATASGDCSVKIWDIRKLGNSNTQQELFSIPAHKKLVSDVRFFRKRQENEKFTQPVTDENDQDPSSLDFNASFLITSSYDNTVNVWSADNWVKIKSLEGHNDKVMSCDISGDGNHFVSSGWDRTVKLWSDAL